MRKNISILVFALFVICFSTSTLHSQWQAEKSYLGPTLGLSFLGSSPQFGANYEYGYTLKDVGVIGIGGILRYWSYSESFFTGKYNYTNIIIGAQANYHFKVESKTFDPWAGLVLGYNISSSSWEWASGYNNTWGNSFSASNGGLILNLQGGIRYFINSKLALVARFGYGNASYGSIDIGVDFTL